jgi:hypothetical protein
LKNWLYQTERQKNLWHTAAIAEAEDASEREAALACFEARCFLNSLGLGQ